MDQEATYVESSLELMGRYAEDIKAGRPVPVDLSAVGRKAACLTLLLETKRVLIKVFRLTENQMANYSEKRGREGVRRAIKNTGAGEACKEALAAFSEVHTSEGDHEWIKQCKGFKKAMKADSGMRVKGTFGIKRESPPKSAVTDTPESTPSDQSMDGRVSLPVKRKAEGAERQLRRGSMSKRKLLM